jgi:predicted dehydrogenase
MKTLQNIIWGIIGAGDVCEVKSAPAMMQIAHSEIKTVMRRNEIKAADYAKRHNIPNWTTDLNSILNDKEINAVYIATPPSTHAELTLKAAKAGKAVYVEKPMAMSAGECRKMIDVCAEAGVPLFVAYYRRTLPGYLKVKEIVDAGVLGDIRFVNIEMNQPLNPNIIANSSQNWRVQPEIAGGGYFHDLASHQLDFLDFLFGEIIEAHGFSANQAGTYSADDIVSATFKFENGIIGSGLWCFTVNPVSEIDEIKIVGSKGELSFNTFGNPMIINVLTQMSGNEEFVINHNQPIQKPLIQLIVDELRGTGISPSTGISGARTAKVMDLITN